MDYRRQQIQLHMEVAPYGGVKSGLFKPGFLGILGGDKQ